MVRQNSYITSYNGEEKYIGGAGIAKHLKEAGGDVTLQVLLEMMNLVIMLIMSLKNIKVNFIFDKSDLQPIKMCLFLEITDY